MVTQIWETNLTMLVHVDITDMFGLRGLRAETCPYDIANIMYVFIYM